jgi:hypothetical protein
MKTRVRISFRAENLPGDAAAILTPTGCGPDVAEVIDFTLYGKRDVSVYMKLDEDDERVPNVFALLKHYGVEFKSFTYDEYSDEDRQNARLLWMGPSSIDDLVVAGPHLGTEYDLTHACPHCETGAKQTSLLYVDHDDMKIIRKHRAVWTTDNNILVDGGMRKKLVDAGITGIRSRQARARPAEISRAGRLRARLMRCAPGSPDRPLRAWARGCAPP